MSCSRGERNAYPRSHPREFDSRSFVHRYCRAAGVAEENLSVFHIRRHFNVIDGRKERAGMTMEHVVITLSVYVNLTFQAKKVFFPAILRAEMIQIGLDMFLHYSAELGHYRFL